MEAALAFGIRVASAGLVFAMQVLLARLMDLEAYGNYVTVWTWLIALGSFGALGFAESAVRFLPRYGARGRREVVTQFWRFGLGVAILSSVALAAIAALVGLAVEIGPTERLILIFICIGFPFLALEHYLEGVARSFGWFRLTTVPVYILRPLLIGGTALGLWLAGVELTLGVVGTLVVACQATITIAIALVLAVRLKPGAARLAKRAGANRRLFWLKASIPLLFISGLEDLMTNTDILVVALLLTPEEVGIYFAAARVLALANFVYYAMYLVSGRGFALALVDTDRDQLQVAVREATRLTFWSTVVALAMTLVAGPVLLALFGPEFEDGYAIMLVLAVGLLARSVAGQSNEVLIVAGRQRESIVIAAATFGLNLVLTVSLALGFGVLGAALGTSLSLAFRAGLYVLAVRRRLGVKVVSFGLPSLRPAT